VVVLYQITEMRSLVILLCLLSTITLNSCQKEFTQPVEAARAVIKGECKAKINGVEFVAVLTGASIRTDGVISIAAESNNRQMIVFAVKDSGVHIYSLPMKSAFNYGGYTDAFSIAFASNEGINPGDSGGSLSINSIDRQNRLISGTFEFKAFHADNRTQRIITEGVFNNISF
jgi:Family of unknown function (DUF6252)